MLPQLPRPSRVRDFKRSGTDFLEPPHDYWCEVASGTFNAGVMPCFERVVALPGSIKLAIFHAASTP
jgi:hypothetical protein